ncbi:MAG TPA: YibE/F family protein [Acidimicrobiales bacterium]|nr:YibE/F family protein [Acidimicrobiales bacterium]
MAMGDQRTQGRAARSLTVGVVVAGALAVLGFVAYWPRGDAPELPPQPNTYVDATLTGIDTQTCDDFETGSTTSCQVVSARLTSGPDDGDEIEFQVRSTEFNVPELQEGDEVVLLDVATSPPEFRYSFSDFQRRMPLLWLVAAFVVVVILFGRFQGVRALLGLAASGAVLVAFVVPALLRDSPALPVALAGTVAIAFAALYLAHGLKLGTTVALAGTLVSLAITSLLAVVVVSATHLTGLVGDQTAQVLRVTAEALDLRGLLVAGIVVGALGVLDDVTVSQVSIVAALRRANPGLSWRLLYGEAMRVGRDHVASTVNTLVLAYAGASLPLLLFFAQGDQPVDRLLTGELIAVEIVRMLVGSIGLVASVPITTGLAALVMGDGDAQRVDDGHGHRQARGRDTVGRRAPVATQPPVRPAGAGQGDEPAAGWDGFSPDPDLWPPR